MSQPTTNAPLFGINIDPHPEGLELALELAQYADDAGVDLIGIQDHPYNARHLEMWTLLTALGATTRRVRLLPNVANLPLRPPALLAKAAATLDLLTGGRVELGLGAGAMWDAVAAYGGPRRSGGEAVDALDEAIRVLRLLWGEGGDTNPVRFAGTHYQLEGAHPGPRPNHRIGIWLGALKPRMVRLTGQLADGWSVSHNWLPPDQVRELRPLLDTAAAEAGRPPAAIRRNYNLMGVIQPPGQPALRVRQPGMLAGTPERWADLIVSFVEELGMDTFIFWPVAGDTREQMRLWAEEVAPAVRGVRG